MKDGQPPNLVSLYNDCYEIEPFAFKRVYIHFGTSNGHLNRIKFNIFYLNDIRHGAA
jgi:hypothetical protein